MSNKMRGYVTIDLDKARNLKFGTNALRELEETLNIKVMSLDKVEMGIKEIQTFVYFGLKHEDKSLTFEQAGDLMDEAESLEYIAEKIGEAIRVAFDKKSKATEGN